MNEQQAKELVKEQITGKINYEMNNFCADVSLLISAIVIFCNFYFRNNLWCITNYVSMIAIALAIITVIFNRKRDDKKYFWYVIIMTSNVGLVIDNICLKVLEHIHQGFVALFLVVVIGAGCVGFFWEKHKIKCYSEKAEEDLTDMPWGCFVILLMGLSLILSFRNAQTVQDYVGTFAFCMMMMYSYIWGEKMAKIISCIRNVKKYKLQEYMEEILREYENDVEDESVKTDI